MTRIYFLTAACIVSFLHFCTAQYDHSKNTRSVLKKHKVGLFMGNSLIHEVHNSKTGREQYVLAPTFGLDYEFWLSNRWAIGTYNELAYLNIEVEQDHEEFLKRENVLLFSAVAVYEPVHNLGIFAGTGLETDPHHIFWIRYLGIEYSILRYNDWDVSITAGYVNKNLYDVCTFGIIIARRFGKPIGGRHGR